ncbi:MULTISPECIES: stage VI sporulation protein F [Paenibacillus]|uniref:stage VI sporulation protein F n=1 Tax=Paenibacillus TaxID=44249 RepID=UPI0022B877C7|nr:stage VI sporulation protein F [Paenibacillus caseinilyticus]MCZ8520550.1 stage VI sporulation protein F [Paenibacillus caseinilyticus]
MSGNKNMPKDVLNVVKKKTGKNVSEKDIYKLASGVKPTTVQSDAQLKQLIKQVSSLVNVPVSDQTMNELIQAIKSSKMNTSNMEQLMKMIMKK